MSVFVIWNIYSNVHTVEGSDWILVSTYLYLGPLNINMFWNLLWSYSGKFSRESKNSVGPFGGKQNATQCRPLFPACVCIHDQQLALFSKWWIDRRRIRPERRKMINKVSTRNCSFENNDQCGALVEIFRIILRLHSRGQVKQVLVLIDNVLSASY